MTWYKDLTPCSYFQQELSPFLKAVGWLERGHRYSKRPIDPAVRARINTLLQRAKLIICYRGKHYCDFCRPNDPGPWTHRTPLWPATFWNFFVPGIKTVYACNGLLTHYIDAHGYGPPREFCRAIMACPELDSPEYVAALWDRAPLLMETQLYMFLPQEERAALYRARVLSRSTRSPQC